MAIQINGLRKILTMRNKTRLTVTHRKQQGLAMIEFALVFPFLLLVLVSTAEIGFMMQQQSTLIKSVETGARFISVNTTNGSGIVSITAETLQNTRNMVMYGNASGDGDPIIRGLHDFNININCTNGTQNGNCVRNFGLTPITIQANHLYSPLLGELFDSVTGFNYFPHTLTAITIVESI